MSSASPFLLEITFVPPPESLLLQSRVMGGLGKDGKSRGDAFVAPQTRDLFA